MGISFRKFVTFDDYLSANTSHKQCESTERSHNYNLRTRKAGLNDPFNFAIDSKERDLIVDDAQVSENSKEICEEKNIDWKRKKSHDEAQLDEEKAKSSDESTSRKNEGIVISTSARLPKVIDIQTIESTTRSSKSIRASMQASVNESRTNTEYDCKPDKTVINEERCKNSRVLSNERSIGSPEVDNANDDRITLQPVFNVAVNSDTKEPNAKAISYVIPKEVESTDVDRNACFSQKSLKRHSDNAEEFQNNFNDDKPEQKRSKSDTDWMKQYETKFVFGPSDLASTITTVSDSDNGVSLRD